MNIAWPEFHLVPLDSVVVDKRYQRELSEKRVEDIVNNFDADLFGTVTVSRRHDGTYAVIDGQHRVSALAMIDSSAKVPVLLTKTAESPQHEAEVFVQVNTNRKATTPFQNWTAAAFADPESLEAKTNRILDSLGLTLCESNTKALNGSNVRAVGAIKFVLEKGGLPLVRDTMTIINTHFKGMDAAFAQGIIRGVATFLWTYEDKLTLAKVNNAFTQELKSIGSTMTPIRILQQAATIQSVRSRAVSDRLLKAYNSHNKTKIQYRETRSATGDYKGLGHS